MKNKLIAPSIIIAGGIILSVSLYSYKDELKFLFKGDGPKTIKERYKIEYDINSGLLYTYGILKSKHTIGLSFDAFRRDFYSRDSRLRCFLISNDVLFLPADQTKAILKDIPASKLLSLCAYKKDTFLVFHDDLRKLKKELPSVKSVHTGY